MKRIHQALLLLIIWISIAPSVVAQTPHRNHGASLSLAIGHRNADSTRTKVVDLGIVGAADTLRAHRCKP